MADPQSAYDALVAPHWLAAAAINQGSNAALYKTLTKMPYDSGNSAALDKFVDRLSSRVDLLPGINNALAQGNTSDRFVALSKRSDFGNVLDKVAQNPGNFTNIVAQSYSADFGGSPQQPAKKTNTPNAQGQQDTDDADGDDSHRQRAVAQNQDPKKKTEPEATANSPNPAPPPAPAKPNQPPVQDVGMAADGISSAQEAKIMMSVIGLVGAMFSAKGGFMNALSDIFSAIQGKGEIRDPGVKAAMAGIMGTVFGGPDGAASSTATVTGDHPGAQTSLNISRASALGFGINGEEGKADAIRTKDGEKAVSYTKGADGLYSVSMKLPDGSQEFWHQTDLMTDAKTGAKFMAYERTNADGTLFHDPTTKKPQAFIESVGNLGTQQDIAAMDKIVKGLDAHELFDKTSEYTDQWIKNTQVRAAARAGTEGPLRAEDMPTVTIGAHSMGAYTVGAITQKLNDNHLTPQQTIEIEPVGAGAGIEFLAKGNPAIATALTQNVVSLREKDSMFSAPGGQFAHANSMVGQTFQYVNPTNDNSGSFPAALMANHALSLPADMMNRQGADAFGHTPSLDTTSTQFVGDARLDAGLQGRAEQGLKMFENFTAGHGAPAATDLALAETVAPVPSSASRPNPAALRQQSMVATNQTTSAPEPASKPKPVVVSVAPPAPPKTTLASNNYTPPPSAPKTRSQINP